MSHEQYQSCIEACQQCAVECNHCAIACLKEDEVKKLGSMKNRVGNQI